MTATAHAPSQKQVTAVIGSPNPRGVDIVLRTATEDDVAFLTDVVVAATRAQRRLPADFDEMEFRAGFADWTREQVRGDLPGSSTCVVEIDGVPVGRLRVVRTEELVELAGVQLRPAHQSSGIGARIVGALAAEARGQGVPLELGVEQDNPRPREFSERCGLRHVGDHGDEHRMRLV